MPTRYPTVAGLFYPEGEAACRREVRACLQGAGAAPARGLRGGVVPHAGWTFSGRTAARVYAALHAQGTPDTVVLAAAVHGWGAQAACVYGSGAWVTPLGAIKVDEELARQVVEMAGGLIVDQPEAHAAEHSIEVQLPFVQHLFPEARILPVATPPAAACIETGQVVARAIEALGRTAWAVGSTDLTHYGPRYGYAPAGPGEAGLAWARQNDQRLLDLVTTMQLDAILPEAEARRNACGAGAIVATIAHALTVGATRGIVLDYTTSYQVMPIGPLVDLVGYGAVVFV